MALLLLPHHRPPLTESFCLKDFSKSVLGGIWTFWKDPLLPDQNYFRDWFLPFSICYLLLNKGISSWCFNFGASAYQILNRPN